MVDVGDKTISHRTATARGQVVFEPEQWDALLSQIRHVLSAQGGGGGGGEPLEFAKAGELIQRAGEQMKVEQQVQRYETKLRAATSAEALLAALQKPRKARGVVKDVGLTNVDVSRLRPLLEEEDGPEILSTEQWMNSVDTRAGDFLRMRFLLEASGAQ